MIPCVFSLSDSILISVAGNPEWCRTKLVVCALRLLKDRFVNQGRCWGHNVVSLIMLRIKTKSSVLFFDQSHGLPFLVAAFAARMTIPIFPFRSSSQSPNLQLKSSINLSINSLSGRPTR